MTLSSGGNKAANRNLAIGEIYVCCLKSSTSIRCLEEQRIRIVLNVCQSQFLVEMFLQRVPSENITSEHYYFCSNLAIVPQHYFSTLSCLSFDA